ncbi:YggS family pyridoxal phosphate enzyme [Nesterenkonia jeotgali]|uniref:YggS family pyridoxal phosphate enzyme n=1 Tax=Nesterenkonia jeotgali TaxID=317018 RepID=UPI0009F98621|nr:YggS family pyridoxal phosphate enzyme [Nesterenkonia jeotgali]
MQTSPEPASPDAASPDVADPGAADPGAEDPRSEELAANLAAVHARIDRAMEAAGREDRPTLIVVTKFFPAADVLRLHRLGVRDVGENRDQEAAAKAAEVTELLRAGTAAPATPESPGAPAGPADDPASDPADDPGDDPAADPASGPAADEEILHWHFIGQLQSNKARSVTGYADHLHSVDRSSLLKALIKVAPSADEPPLTCLIQVDLRDPVPADGRGGADPASILELADRIAAAPGLALGGLMAVAPLDEPAAPAFRRLRELSAQLRERHPRADMISAGMSGDLEEAVAHGATHLRVGRDVLGARPLQR